MISKRDAAGTYWHVRLFGPLHLMRKQEVMVRFGSRKPGVLLACLAMPPGQAKGREYLAETIWPDSNGSASRANLRFVLSSLKKDLEPPAVAAGTVLRADATTVELRADAVSTDVQQFEHALDSAFDAPLSTRERIVLLKKAAALYQGDLLLGFYDNWIVDERERLKERHRLGLSTLARLLEDEGEFRSALPYAEAATSADVLREESHTHVVRLHLALWDGVSAQRQYRRMESIFQTQMNHGPSAGAKALVPIIRECIRKQNPPRTKSASLPATLPPSGTYSAYSFVLPRPLTKFFDRPERVHVVSILQTLQTRLLTLTGPSGSGKTRLAIEAAEALRGVFGSAIWFLPAAEYENTEMFTNAILDAVGLNRASQLTVGADENDGNGVDESRIAGSDRQPSLLVIDGFEHLVDSGQVVVHDILQRVPHLSCLVTSGVRLHLSGEAVLEICPLPVPEKSDADSQVLDNPSCQMLLDRIRLVRPEFALTRANRGDIVELCQRLEGLPLSIELAAPWMQVLSLHEIMQQLSDPFTLLVSDRVDIPAPHRSLHEAVQRSYNLLPPYLREFFCSLSVFETGWTREAAETVLEEPQAASYLRQLREYSLVHTTERGDKVHFYLLDVVKKFAWNLLNGSKQENLARRHAEYYLHIGFEAESHIGGTEREEWFAELDLRMPNFRRALDWCLEKNKEQYLFLVAALWIFWYLRGHIHEGENRLQQAMAWIRGDSDAANARVAKDLVLGTEPAIAKILLGLACLAWAQNDGSAGRSLLLQSLAAFRTVRHPSNTAGYLSGLAKFGAFRGDYELARCLLQEAQSLWQEARQSPKKGEPVSGRLNWELADAIRRLGDVAYCEANFPEAQARYQESFVLFESASDWEGIAATYTGMGGVARARGNYDEAREHLSKSLHIRTQQNDLRGIATAQRILACIDTRAGRFDQARIRVEECFTTLSAHANVDGMTGHLIVAGTLDLCENKIEKAEESFRTALSLAQQRANSRRAAYSRTFLSLVLLRGGTQAALPILKKSVRWFHDVGDLSGLALSLEVYAAFAAEEKRWGKAVGLWGAAVNIRDAIGSPSPPSYIALYNRHLDKARAVLGNDAFEITQAADQHTVSLHNILADVA